MKKIFSIFIICVILIMSSNMAFATNSNHEREKIEEVCKIALDSYMKTFMTEEIPEQDRIKDYNCITIQFSKDRENADKIDVNITVHITPENENNTTWNKTRNYCFALFTKVDGEYILDKISRYPDYYDEFLERFEEYKKNNPTTIENTQIQVEEMTNSFSNQEIDKMSKIIFVSCSIVLSIMIIFIITKFIKSRK